MALPDAICRFGPYELRTRTRELYKHGIRLKLRPQPFHVLHALVERAGDVVTREELRKELWPSDTFVDFEHGLNNSIKELRAVLGDSIDEPRYIETLPRLGYRLITPVEVNEPPLDAVRDHEPRGTPQAHRRLVLAGVTVFVLLVLAYGMIRIRAGNTTRPRIKALAVLPLKNLSGDPNQDYLADGMTEALIGRLSSIHDLRVVSRTSVMRFKDTKLSVSEIAKTLGVDALVEGSVIREGSRIRVHAQLIRAATDEHFWSEAYDREMRDALALESDVAQSITRKVEVTITGEERARLSAKASVNPKAYETYLKGRYFQNKRTQEGLRRAMEYYQQAVDEDPRYAPAYAGLADTYFPLTNWGWVSIREAIPKAKAAALKAVEFDEGLAEAHVPLGMVRFVYDWDWPEAGKQFEQALALNPAYPLAHMWYSYYLMALGRSDESLAEMKRAVDLDPVSPELSHYMAWLLGMIGRYDEAIAQERQTLEMDPGFPPAYSVLADAYAAKGMYREALAEIEKLSALSPGSPVALVALASVHAQSGERSRALREFRALSKRGYVSSYDFALLYLRLGNQDQAFRWLEKAYEERSSYLPWLKENAAWAHVRSDLRFSDLLRRLGLPE